MKKTNNKYRLYGMLAILVIIVIIIVYAAPLVSESKGKFGASAGGFDPADTNQDNVITLDEMMNAYDMYGQGILTDQQLDLSISRWKAGGY